jgi:serine/threonine protein kinase
MMILRRGNYPFTPVVVAKRYEILREIGSGAFGTVYEANDLELGRRVAVKVLDLVDRDVAMREAQALAELDHQNVVAIYDHGTGPDFRYLVLQLLPGPTLRAWSGGVPDRQTICAFVEAGRGLAAAHAQGLVHRDFKPSNVRMGADGTAVVVDFGLARHKDAADPNERTVFAGTIDYAAPERLFGEPADELSDQFSFCVALWEALSGVNPFGPCTPSTTTTDRLRAIMKGPAGTPRGSRQVTRALRQGLSLRPHDRFPSMLALTDTLVPKPLGWTSKAMLLAVLVGAGLTQLVPSPSPGASSEFVASTHTRCLGPLAVAHARKGNVEGALHSLKLAESANRRRETSRDFAIASEAVARELERRITPNFGGDALEDALKDALVAWEFALAFARHADDADLRTEAREQVNAVHNRLKVLQSQSK